MEQFIKKEGKKKMRRARLRKIEIDPKKSSNFGLRSSAKNPFNYIPVVGNMPSVLQTSLSAILTVLMIVKNQYKKGNSENIFFSFLAGRHQSVNSYIWA